jgi:hypothetical protein
MSKKTKKEKEKPISVEIARETMTGDIRECILDVLKHGIQKPWQQLSEFEQRDVVAKAEAAARDAANKAVDIIVADGRPTIIAALESVAVKDGIKAIVKLSKDDELRHDLMDSQGKTILLIVTDKASYHGEREPSKIDKDQLSLIETNDNSDKSVFDNTAAGRNDRRVARRKKAA